MSWFGKKPLAEFSDEEIAEEFREREARIRKAERIARLVQFGEDVIAFAQKERVSVKLMEDECSPNYAVWRVSFDTAGWGLD